MKRAAMVAVILVLMLGTVYFLSQSSPIDSDQAWLMEKARTAVYLDRPPGADGLEAGAALSAAFPQRVESWLLQGRLLYQSARWSEAEAAFAKAERIAPNLSLPTFSRALCLIRQGSLAEAERLLQTIPAARDRQLPSWIVPHWLTRVAAARGDGSLARQRATSIGPHEPRWLFFETQAFALASSGQWDAAMSLQQKALVAAREERASQPPNALLERLQAYVERRFPSEIMPEIPVDYLRLAAIPAPRSTNPISSAQARQSHDKMIAFLASLPNRLDPMATTYLNRERAALLQAEMSRANDINLFLRLQPEIAQEQLRAGLSRESIDGFSRLLNVIKEMGVPFEGEQKTWLLHRLALAYLRLGEQENCILNHSSASCIVPIQGDGVHQLTSGSENAMRIYDEILREFPDDLTARWLYNLAAMTLNRHDQVPENLHISLERFTPKSVFPRFQDRGTDLGLGVNALSGGSIVEDFDGDLDLDILVSSWGLSDELNLFINNGAGGFSDVTDQAGLIGITGGLNMIQADYDNDGDTDVLILRGAWMASQGKHPNSLLRNNGDGTFIDVTEPSGLLSFHPTQTAVWFDYNNDGWLDVFIGNESDKEESHPCQLYRNNGDGTFSDIAALAGADHIGFVKGVAVGDIDNDGRMDLYISNYTQANRLLRNVGPSDDSANAIWRFDDVTDKAGVAQPEISFPTWFWDIENDGDLDLLVLDYENRNFDWVVADRLEIDHPGARTKLYQNRGDGTFEDISSTSGFDRVFLAMGSNFGDIDFDGFPDAYIGTGAPNLRTLVPNVLMHNQGNGTFVDVTGAGGFGHLQKGHGVSFADIDHDGDQDVHITMGGAYQGDTYQNALFENPGTPNNWLKLKLEGRTANRSAIGARIRVHLSEAQGDRDVYAHIGSGGSFGASPLRAEIGLGQATAIHWIEVLWPGSGTVQRFAGVKPNRFYRIIEHVPTAEQLHHQVTPFQTTEHQQHHEP